MSENEKNSFGGDDFWNLDEYAKKKPIPSQIKQFSKSATESTEISEADNAPQVKSSFSDNAHCAEQPADPSVRSLRNSESK